MAALVAGAVLLHWGVAERRSASLLSHDEAISLLAAAGKSDRIDDLYQEMQTGPLVRQAEDIQNLLRPTSDIRTVDVVRSLSRRDIHPPLYFLILHGLSRLGVHSESLLRLFGSAMFFVAAWIANRWIWPQAWGPAKWLGTAWLLATPATVNIATELRQYALVYLGVVLSIAALLGLWEERKPVRHTLMLLALSPVVLLWTQFGNSVWVGIGFAVLAAHTVTSFRSRYKLAMGSAAAALVLLSPLLLWTSRIYAVQDRPALEPPADFYGGVVRPLSAGLTESWCWLPWTWRETVAPSAVAAVVIVGITAMLWRRRWADRVLFGAGVAWGAAWFVLLALGRVPPHAVEPKQLAPLTLVPVFLIVRAASRTGAKWFRGVILTVLVVSFGGLSVRTWQMLSAPQDAVLLTALAESDCLVSNAPKRGYLLPLAARMRPEALVIVASPQAALEQWPRMVTRLPRERLLLVEIGTCDGGQELGAKELAERLGRMYREVRVLREGPRRTVTEFRIRRDGGENTEN